jgi:hypothetical protein
MKAESGGQGYSFEIRGMWGKERGYNLVISGGNVKGEISSDNRQADRFVVYRVLYTDSAG